MIHNVIDFNTGNHGLDVLQECKKPFKNISILFSETVLLKHYEKQRTNVGIVRETTFEDACFQKEALCIDIFRKVLQNK